VAHLITCGVTFVSISRVPLARLREYKRRMGWKFPWVSSYGSLYPYDSGWNVFEFSGGDVYRTSSRQARCV
jgi:predicted dithiol-disulfide oxidoreductase (DUF899 family)